LMKGGHKGIKARKTTTGRKRDGSGKEKSINLKKEKKFEPQRKLTGKVTRGRGAKAQGKKKNA